MEAYFVTTHYNLLNPLEHCSRTVGFFETLEEAKRVVEENVCDIFEFYYGHATIEKISDGIYPCIGSDDVIFYEWDSKQDGYREIERPEGMENLFGFSNIG